MVDTFATLLGGLQNYAWQDCVLRWREACDAAGEGAVNPEALWDTVCGELEGMMLDPALGRAVSAETSLQVLGRYGVAGEMDEFRMGMHELVSLFNNGTAGVLPPDLGLDPHSALLPQLRKLMRCFGLEVSPGVSLLTALNAQYNRVHGSAGDPPAFEPVPHVAASYVDLKSLVTTAEQAAFLGSFDTLFGHRGPGYLAQFIEIVNVYDRRALSSGAIKTRVIELFKDNATVALAAGCFFDQFTRVTEDDLHRYVLACSEAAAAGAKDAARGSKASGGGGSAKKSKKRGPKKEKPSVRVLPRRAGALINYETLPDGTPKCPLTVATGTVLEAVGTLPNLDNLTAFHTSNYIYPVGLRIRREWHSSDPAWETSPEASKSDYLCEIELNESGGAPVFKVIEQRDGGLSAEGTTPTGAWNIICGKVNEIRGTEIKVSGPSWFGFANATVAHVLQNLPGVDRCLKYIPIDFTQIDRVSSASTRKRRRSSASRTRDESPATGDDGAGSATPSGGDTEMKSAPATPPPSKPSLGDKIASFTAARAAALGTPTQPGEEGEGAGGDELADEEPKAKRQRLD